MKQGYTLHSTGENYVHFRKDPKSAMESFSVTYCHDGTVCMTGDMGCLAWRREYFPKIMDYGFPYADTGIDYFAEKIVRAGESQRIRTWDREFAIIDIENAILEPRDEADRDTLVYVMGCLSGYESDDYGQFQMLEEFENHVHSIETEETCSFGMDYTTMFKMRFEMLKSVSPLILAHVKRGA